MPRPHIHRHHRAVGAIALVLLGGLLLAACGGGSSKSTSSTASAKVGASGRRGFAARAATLRTCLKKEGITLPERKPGGGTGGQPRGPFGGGAPGGGSGAPGGGFQLPKGVTREKMQAALKKCGAGSLGFRRRSFGTRNPQQFAKFASCMRANGVSLPAPNTSGKGPVFNTKGIDTTSSAFKQADAKCAKELRTSGPPAGSPG
jgi:hypothetical protein